MNAAYISKVILIKHIFECVESLIAVSLLCNEILYNVNI